MAKNPKMVQCRNCNAEISKKAKICPACGVKNKKPLYKRIWFLLLILIAVITGVNSCNGKKSEKIDWNDIELNEYLSKPDSDKGEIMTNLEDSLSVYIHKMSKDDYKSYLAECQAMGFSIESEKSESGYHAFNSDGYVLTLWYIESDEELSIQLEAPMEMGELRWPVNEMSASLPAPKSDKGIISRDSSEGCFIYVGETTIDDYNDYVRECTENGFEIDYEKGATYYYAENAEGYKLSLNYQGNGVMSIEMKKLEYIEAVETPAEEEAVQTDDEDAASQEIETVEADEKESASGVRPEFKEIMDSYEAFFDEYIDFMEKYINADADDLVVLMDDYADYMAKYAETIKKMEAVENEEMSTEEAIYYAEVTSRITKKLLEVQM